VSETPVAARYLRQSASVSESGGKDERSLSSCESRRDCRTGFLEHYSLVSVSLDIRSWICVNQPNSYQILDPFLVVQFLASAPFLQCTKWLISVHKNAGQQEADPCQETALRLWIK